MLKEIPSNIERIIEEIASGANVYMLVPVQALTCISEMAKAAGYVVEEAEKEPETEPEEERTEEEEKPTEIPEGGSKEPEKKRGRKKKEPTPEKKVEFDLGKALALHMAGWSNYAIADEMGCTELEVINKLKEAENE